MALTRPKAAQIDFDVTNLTDPLIRLNSGQSGSADKDSGIVIERGSDTNVAFVWDESADQFAVINTDETGTTSGNVTISSYAGIKVGEATLESTDTGSAAGPIINLKRDSSSPANADYLGQIKFKGENSSGGEVNYAKITGKILDVTDGSEDGILEFAFIKGGSQNISGRFRSDQLQLLNGTKLYIGGSGSIQFEGDSSNAHETTINVTEPTQDNTITFPNSTGTVALTNSFTKFHSAVQTVTSSQETTNVSATVDFTFSDLTTAINYNVFLNRTLLRPAEFSVSGSTLTIAVGILAQDDELEVSGFKT